MVNVSEHRLLAQWARRVHDLSDPVAKGTAGAPMLIPVFRTFAPVTMTLLQRYAAENYLPLAAVIAGLAELERTGLIERRSDGSYAVCLPDDVR